MSAEHRTEGRERTQLVRRSPLHTSAAPRPEDLVGRSLLGTYRLDRLIMCGGMGAIYEGLHLRLQRRVAVKMLLPHHAQTPSLVERFRREAELIGHMEHPNIVQVLDVDTADNGSPFFVMEYLDGQTLHDRLRTEGPLPLLEAVRIVSQVAAALALVHAHGVVHCDLKPTNVFLVQVPGQPDFVKMIDFGVSTDTSRVTAAAPPLEIAGTPSYMAPEQALGRHPLDARADQFALAAITYEVVSGRRAFSGTDEAAVLAQVVSGEPPALSEIAPWVPSVLDKVLRKALSKQPSERFGSVSAFAWALDNAVLEAGLDRHSKSAVSGRYSQKPMALEAVREPRPSRSVRSSEPPTSIERRSVPTGARPEDVPPSAMAEDALERLHSARRLRGEGRLDEAVAVAEGLLELAVTDRSPGVLRALAAGVSTLDAIFEERVGGDERRLAQGPGLQALRFTLSPRAAQLVANLDEPTTVSTLVKTSGMPRRDCIRLVAGLLRRGVLRAA